MNIINNKTPENEEKNVPEWMKTLENRKRKGHKLAHEIGAGSPCLKCQEKCPGLDLHFWRKICRNCKCKKEDHDVQDEDDFEQFEILLGPSKKKNKKLLAFDINSEDNQPSSKENDEPTLFDWIPPNVNDDLAIEYLKQLPPSRLPISGSDGALERKRAFERQLPLHDFNAELCHNLSNDETNAQAEYLNNLKSHVVGQGTVFKIGTFNQNRLADLKLPGSQSAHCLGAFNKNSNAFNPTPKPFVASKFQNDPSVQPPPPSFNLDTHPSLKQPSHFIGNQPGKENKQGETAIAQSQPQEMQYGVQKERIISEMANSQNLTHNKELSQPYFGGRTQEELANSQGNKGHGQNPPLQYGLQNERIISEMANSQDLSHNRGFAKNNEESQQHPLEYGRQFERLMPEMANSQQLTHNRGFVKNNDESQQNPLEYGRQFERLMPEMSHSQDLIHNRGFAKNNDESQLPLEYGHQRYMPEMSHSEDLIHNRGFAKNDDSQQLPLEYGRQFEGLMPEMANSQELSHYRGGFAKNNDQSQQHSLEYERQFEGLMPEMANSQELTHNRGFVKNNDESQQHPLEYGRQFERLMPEMSHSQELTHNKGLSIPYPKIGDQKADPYQTGGFQNNNHPLLMHNNNPQNPVSGVVTRDTLPPNNLLAYSNAVPTDALPKAAHLLGQMTLRDDDDADQLPAENQALPMISNDAGYENVACAKCNQVLNFGDVAVFADRAGPAKVWHPKCFTCGVCNELLADLIYFYYGDTVYCGRHYAEVLQIPRCHACDELIFVKEYTLAEEHAYHYKHFCCLECDKPLGGLRYVPVEDHPVCLDCYQRVYGKKCAKCNQFIAADEKRLQIGNFTWHVNDRCFTCTTCGRNLVGQRMICTQGIPFCSKECALKNK